MSKTVSRSFLRRNGRRPTALAWAIVSLALAVLGACFGMGAKDPAAPASPVSEARWTGTVTRVIDGDTLSVVPLAGGPPRKVRIDGIDAPESCQPFGGRARDALRTRVLRRQVTVQTRQLDVYRRELARVTLDGQDLGAWMVAQGNAWSYRYQHDSGPYQYEERTAQRAGRGLFADRAAQPPRAFRKAHGPCP